MLAFLQANKLGQELLILGPVLLVFGACANNLVLSEDMSGLFVVVMIFVAVWAAVMNGKRVMERTLAQLPPLTPEDAAVLRKPSE